jgi:hypothetical protein
MSVGEIGQASRYGRAQVRAFRLDAGIDFFLYRGIKLAIIGIYEQYSFTFVGTGALEANGALDQYYGGVITIGYVL